MPFVRTRPEPHPWSLGAFAVAAVAGALFGNPLGAQSTATAASLLCERTMDGTRFPDAKARMQAMAAGVAPDAAFARGCLFMGDGQFEKASNEFERAVAADQASAAYHFQLGQAYGARAQHANIFKQAVLARKTKAEFDRAVQLDPDLIDARVGLVTFYLLAPGILGGSADKARREAQEIRVRNPYRGGIAFAQIAGHENDLPAATRELDALTRQFPDSTAPYVALATGYAERKLWTDAWDVADRFARALPDAPVGLYLVGRLAAESGEQLDRGAAALSQYLQTTPRAGDPPLAVAQWRLGAIEERRGKPDAARAEYEAALRLDPKLAGAREALGRLH
ncbi:hypothetical protein tb265_23400 [Gemmatimonadetes bacterium T265]|nr:hypothetical protein tb265_23400 [Gemmatimonadetes bacterium T265]